MDPCLLDWSNLSQIIWPWICFKSCCQWILALENFFNKVDFVFQNGLINFQLVKNIFKSTRKCSRAHQVKNLIEMISNLKSIPPMFVFHTFKSIIINIIDGNWMQGGYNWLILSGFQKIQFWFIFHESSLSIFLVTASLSCWFEKSLSPKST